jgi:hypothetical protein
MEKWNGTRSPNVTWCRGSARESEGETFKSASVDQFVFVALIKNQSYSVQYEILGILLLAKSII